MKIVRYGNDSVILDRVLGVGVVHEKKEKLIKEHTFCQDKYEIITVYKIMFYYEESSLFLKMPSKEQAIKASNKIIDFLKNDEKILDLTNQETQCS